MSSVRDAELFKSPCAQLYLVGDGASESLLMQTGRFAVVLVKNPVSQLGAVVAMVDEVQWPVGFDASVMKKEEGSFTFVLPGFIVYDLVLKELPSTDLRRLEHVLREYSDYGEPAEVQAKKNATKVAKAADDQAAGPSSRSGSEKPSGAISSQMKRRMLRAHRMSAIVKVFSRSLARGAISASTHVEAKDGAASRNPISPDFNLAGVDAVAKVVEAVETGGRALLEGLGSPAAPATATLAQHEHDAASASASGALLVPMWTLNKPGLLMLYRVITVSLAMHSSSSSSGSGSGRSGSSCSSEIRRLFSSPSFSSSSSSGRSLSTSPSCSGTGDHTATALSLQPPATPPAGVATPSTAAPPPSPPPPPLFSEHPPHARQPAMPPPSVLPPLMASPPQAGTSSSPSAADSSSAAAFRIYKPRPTAATPPVAPPMSPSFIPRPRRFQAPPRS